MSIKWAIFTLLSKTDDDNAAAVVESLKRLKEQYCNNEDVMKHISNSTLARVDAKARRCSIFSYACMRTPSVLRFAEDHAASLSGSCCIFSYRKSDYAPYLCNVNSKGTPEAEVPTKRARKKTTG